MARGEERAAADLLPLVYDDLRRLARSRLGRLPPGQTLQATALVHEAYLSLVGDGARTWKNRGHFFATAARAIRNILVDQARRRASRKRGGDRDREPVDELAIEIQTPLERTLALEEALQRLEVEEPRAAQMVMLRFFAGLTNEQVAEALDVSLRSVEREWRYARTWLHRELTMDEEEGTQAGD